MKSATQCLQPADIKALLAGTVPASQSDSWEEHFSSCESCRMAMAGQVGDKEWWREAEHSLMNASIPEERDAVKSEADERESLEELLKLLGPTDDPQMLGRIGSYEVLGVLGRGGMGVVFKAFDAPLNRFVAIKMLLPHLAASGAARKRFAREGQAVAAVVDDHVMAIHCVDEWQGVPYLVMTYSRGVSLQKRLSDNGPLEVREILRIGMQAAKGLAAAHAQGIVHRDIKPANIFLDQNVERVQLMDFGLARAVDDASLTRSGTLAGTPQYMSPEQARAETVDHRSDLFSLGSVMYAMCTGHAPFRAESSYSVLRLITDKEPRPIREIYPDVPDWLCAIISKLMAKQADDRFVSASVVAELIEESLAHVQQPTTTPLPDAVAKLVKSFGTGTDTHPTKSFDDFRYPPIGKFIAAAAFAFSLIFAGFLIVLELNKGTLTIECEADDVPIRIMKGVEIVEKLTVVRSGSTTRLQAGVYTVEIDDPNSELSIANNHISLSRGANSIVKIQYSLDLTKVTSPAQDHASVKDAKEEVIDDIILKAENSTLDRIEGPVQNAVDSELSFDPPLEELNFNELGFADREVTVTMTARLAGLNLGGNRVGNANSILLCSDSNLPPSSHSVMVFVSQDAAEQIERLGITQPKEHFLNRRVEVKGRLHQIGAGTEGKKPGRTGPFEISVLEASQIQVLRFHGPTKKIAVSEAEPLAPRPEIERDSERATNSTKRVMQDSSEAQENDTAAKNAISNQATGYPDWVVAWDFRYTLMNQRYAMMRISKDGKLEAIFPEQPMVRSQLTLEELAEIVDLVVKNPQSKTQPMSTIADYSLDVRPRPELFDEIKRVNVRSEIVASIHNGELLELDLNTRDSYVVGNHLWKLVGLAAIGGSKELPKFVEVANRELKRNFPNVSDEITASQFSYGIVDRPSGSITIWFDFKVDPTAKLGKVVLRVPQDGQPSMEKVVFPELESSSTKPTEKSETTTELPNTAIPSTAIPFIEKPKLNKGQEFENPLSVEGNPKYPKLPIDRYVKSGVPLAEQTWSMPPWEKRKMD